MSNLKKIAKKNTSVTRKNEDGSVDTLKNGSIADISVKNKSAKIDGDNIIGMSVGLTKNMDNYESLRVDVWATETYRTESERVKKTEHLREVLGEVLEETVRDFI